MISINHVFKIQKNLILTTDESHNYKIGDIITDQDFNKYEIIGVVYQTNDLFVKPLYDYKNNFIEKIA